MLQSSPVTLMGIALLTVLASCAGLEVEAEAEIPGTKVGGLIRVPSDDGYTEETEMALVADQSMEGLTVRALINDRDGNVVEGPPTVLKRGVNRVIVPGGYGPPVLVFAELEPIMATPDRWPLPPPPSATFTRVFCFDQIPWVPLLDTPNVSYHLEIEATSLAEAESFRQLIVETVYPLLAQGIDPGPLPEFIEAASFTRWEVVPSGPEAGDVHFTSMKPGTRVDEYRLDLNGIQAYATLGSGATARTIGDWQVVHAEALAEDINYPAGSGDVVTDEWEIRFDTDVGDALPNRVEYEIEVL